MANLDKPFGLRPVRNGNGSPWDGSANMYAVLAASTDLRIGDLVRTGPSADANGIPTVLPWTNGMVGAQAPLGAIVGILPVGHRPPSLEGTPLALETKGILTTESSTRYVMVTDSSDIVYEVQSDATGFARVVMGRNVNFTVVAGSGATVSKGVVTGAAAAATLPFRLIGFSSRAGNEIGAVDSTITPFIVCLVRPNEHATKVGTVAVAP